jgi:hypothetical protein
MGWMIGGFDSRRGLGIFLLTNASRPALGPTEPPIQWVSGGSFPRVKRQGREAETQRMRGGIPSLPNTPSWRGAQLKHKENFNLLPLSELPIYLPTQCGGSTIQENVYSCPCAQVSESILKAEQSRKL